MNSERVRIELGRLARFGVTGGLATVTSYVSFVVALRLFGLSYLTAYLVACVLGVGLGYLLNSGWTFRGKESRSLGQVVAYSLAQVAVLSAMGWLLTFEVDTLHFAPELAALINVPLGALVGFVLMRWGVFRKAVGKP